MRVRPSLKTTWEALEARGYRPSRRLGQNLLLDPSLHACIVAEAGVGPGEAVLEIGAGAGFLTWHLLEAGARVLAVEVDRRLAAVAREVLGPCEGLSLVEADILAGKQGLNPEVLAAARALAGPGALKVVANLPYSISGPVLALLAACDLALARVVCLVQKELAERLAARPGEAEWGALGFAVALRFSVEILREVPARVFRPQPKVASALVRLEGLARPPVAPGKAGPALRFGRMLFTQRRRTLRAGLRALGLADPAELLARAGLEGGLRVRDLGIEQILVLARLLDQDAATNEKKTNSGLESH